MENNAKPWYLNRDVWALVEKFFVWMLNVYLLWQIKELDKEKTTILQTQIEISVKNKEIESRSLDLLEKVINERSSQNYNSRSDMDNYTNKGQQSSRN